MHLIDLMCQHDFINKNRLVLIGLVGKANEGVYGSRFPIQRLIKNIKTAVEVLPLEGLSRLTHSLQFILQRRI